MVKDMDSVHTLHVQCTMCTWYMCILTVHCTNHSHQLHVCTHSHTANPPEKSDANCHPICTHIHIYMTNVYIYIVHQNNIYMYIDM